VRAGDLDNYEKAIKDALQGIAFVNDRQVCAGRKDKAQDAAHPRTEIEVGPVEDEGPRPRLEDEFDEPTEAT
jgi:Holliday junction resolvase RusA-like endonuclease